ncbi:MAG: radical SAM protein [Pseudomonadota bacterium]|nr:radical SAM protein [Pseudomonadota bacterium]
MMITEKIDRITLIPDNYRHTCPPAPKSVKIELTARCDFQCFFCASHFRLREKRDMDWHFYQRIVNELYDSGVEELGVFYLGESFIYPRLAEAIHYAKAVGFSYVFLTTNGRLATPEKLHACMEAGLDSLKFSVNTATPEQFQSVTGVKASYFETIIEHIQKARQLRDRYGYDCGLYASSIQYDGEQQQKMEATVQRVLPYVDQHYWLPLYGQAGFTAGAHNTQPIAGNQGRMGALRPPLPCWALFTEGHITYDGHLAACCFDHDGRFNMGDLNRMPFMAAWHGASFQALRQANLEQDVTETVCAQCIAYR